MKAALRGRDYAEQVQMLSPEGRGDTPPDVHGAAAVGIATGGGALPYAAQIQRSFGGYDISHVQAHTSAQAQASAAWMGADAYATGHHVVLGAGGQDLHTVAHEAAHVVQQRAGVSLSGGVGQAGDAYERHADAVADRVVRGESAEDLLSEVSGGGASGGGAVQMRGGDGADHPMPMDLGLGSGTSGPPAHATGSDPSVDTQGSGNQKPAEPTGPGQTGRILDVPGIGVGIPEQDAETIDACHSQVATMGDVKNTADTGLLESALDKIYVRQQEGIDAAESSAVEDEEESWLVEALIGVALAGLTGGWTGILGVLAFSVMAKVRAGVVDKPAKEQHRTLLAATLFADGTKEIGKMAGKWAIEELRTLSANDAGKVSKREFFEAARTASEREHNRLPSVVRGLAPNISCAPNPKELIDLLMSAAAATADITKNIQALKMSAAWLNRIAKEEHSNEDGSFDYEDILGGGERGVLNLQADIDRPGMGFRFASATLEGIDTHMLKKMRKVPIRDLGVHLAFEGDFETGTYSGYPGQDMDLAFSPGGHVRAIDENTATLLWLYHRLTGDYRFSISGDADREKARSVSRSAAQKTFDSDIGPRVLGDLIGDD